MYCKLKTLGKNLNPFARWEFTVRSEQLGLCITIVSLKLKNGYLFVRADISTFLLSKVTALKSEGICF